MRAWRTDVVMVVMSHPALRGRSVLVVEDELLIAMDFSSPWILLQLWRKRALTP
jgi:hypothetical protein